MRSPQYAAVQERLARGWNTWDTRSVLNQVRLPDGLLVGLGIKEYYRGLSLHAVQIGRRGEGVEVVDFGPHALDGSYTDCTVTWQEVQVRVQSAWDGDDLVVLVDPLRNQRKPACLTVTVSHVWNRPGTVHRDGDLIVASSGGADTTVHVSGTQVADPYVDVDGPHYVVRLTEPIVVGTGRPRTATEARSLVDARRRQVDEGVDEHHEIVRDAVAWNTLYEPMRERVVTQVSRLWNVQKRGGFSLFCWDSFFGSLLADVGSTDLAYANMLEMLSEVTPEGFVPNVSQGTGRVTLDGSQPPFASLIAWQLYQRHGDDWFLADAFPVLLSWNRWWWRVRRNGPLLCGGSTVAESDSPSIQDVPRIGQHFGATCESGADDHPVFSDIPFDTDTGLLRAWDVGLSSEYGLDCEYLARIADVLGHAAERDELAARGQGVTEAIAGTLWDDDRGIFAYVFTDTEQPTASLSPMNFFPMLAGVGDSGQVESMVTRHLRNPEEFGGEWVVPVSPRNDPRSANDSYWYGRVWPPINFLLTLGLLRAGRTQDAAWLADRSDALFRKEWREHRHSHENYSSETGEGCDVPNSEPYLTWGALLALTVLVEKGEVPYFSEWREAARA